jgi:RNA polymerase sigma-70 factor (ECF subfamily)
LPSRCILVDVTRTSAFAIDVPDALLQRARARDAGACEQLYRWFERPVYALGLRMLGCPDAAMDALQDTFMKVFDKLPGFRAESPFWGWLRQIAVNECLMRLRGRGRDEPAEAEPFEPDLHEHEGLLPPQAADAARLAEALARLPDKTRSVLWLYHAEGYTHEEIAAMLGQSTSFSKSQLARGTRKLRALLQLTEASHA